VALGEKHLKDEKQVEIKAAEISLAHRHHLNYPLDR
jgi:hypothetical protein